MKQAQQIQIRSAQQFQFQFQQNQSLQFQQFEEGFQQLILAALRSFDKTTSDFSDPPTFQDDAL